MHLTHTNNKVITNTIFAFSHIQPAYTWWLYFSCVIRPQLKNDDDKIGTMFGLFHSLFFFVCVDGWNSNFEFCCDFNNNNLPQPQRFWHTNDSKKGNFSSFSHCLCRFCNRFLVMWSCILKSNKVCNIIIIFKFFAAQREQEIKWEKMAKRHRKAENRSNETNAHTNNTKIDKTIRLAEIYSK